MGDSFKNSGDAVSQPQVVVLGDTDTTGRPDLAQLAAEQGLMISGVFTFKVHQAAATDDLTTVEAVCEALARAIADRSDLWIPFPIEDFAREQHWRRLLLVTERHGLNLRFGRKLVICEREGGFSAIDMALRSEVREVDALDNAALAIAGARSLGQEIERSLAGKKGLDRVGRPRVNRYSPPPLPAPSTPWEERQPLLKRYAVWLVHGCGVTQAATARVLNSTGQRTPKGRHWQPGTVSALVNGRYDGVAASR